MGLNNIASGTPVAPANGISGGRRLPVAPQAPRSGGASLVSVNQAALVHSGLDSRGSFVFLKDSAGMGIPRNELGNLKGFSEHAVQKGTATTPIYLNTSPRPSNEIRGVSSAAAPVMIHRGYTPSFPSAEPPSALGSVRGGSMPSGSSNSMPSMSPHASAPSGGAGASGGGAAHH